MAVENVTDVISQTERQEGKDEEGDTSLSGLQSKDFVISVTVY